MAPIKSTLNEVGATLNEVGAAAGLAPYLYAHPIIPVAWAENNTQKCSKQSRFVFIPRGFQSKIQPETSSFLLRDRKKQNTSRAEITPIPNIGLIHAACGSLAENMYGVSSHCHGMGKHSSFMIVHKSALGVRQHRIKRSLPCSQSFLIQIP